MNLPSIEWLARACEAVKNGATLASKAQMETLGLDERTVSCAVSAYISFVFEQKTACKIGNFEFWGWERLSSREDSPETYGGSSGDLLFADWMLDSELCAVDSASGSVVFLGGQQAIVSDISIGTFLRLVLNDPMTPHGMM